MKKGFTLTEMLITIGIFLLVIIAIYTAYILSIRAYQEGERMAELTQNGRVILERITREARQARNIVTDLPLLQEDSIEEIEFEDGHMPERYHYIRYFKDNNQIKREVKRYYFSGSSDTYETWDANPPPGESLLVVVTEEARTIGEFVGFLGFWSSELRAIDVFIILEKNQKQVEFLSRVFGRNL